MTPNGPNICQFYVKLLYVGDDNKGVGNFFFFSILYQRFYIQMISVSFHNKKLFCNGLYNKTSIFISFVLIYNKK
jgi:hypothetical protein